MDDFGYFQKGEIDPFIEKSNISPSKGLKNLFNERKWTEEEKNKELLYLLLHGLDWAQTRTIAKNPNKYSEINPILGRHPSTGRVNNYFLATGLGHLGLNDMLNYPQYRKWFQNSTIGLEALITPRNKFKFGIGATF